MGSAGVGDCRQVDPDAQYIVAAESGVVGAAGVRTPQHQRCADRERERQRHLDHDKSVAKPEAKSAKPERSRPVPELRVQLRPRRLEGRRQPEQEDGKQRRADAENQDAGVERQVQRGHAIGTEADEERGDDLRKQQAERAARAGQQRAFRQQLTHDPASRRTQRQPDGDLLAPGRRPRQQYR